MLRTVGQVNKKEDHTYYWPEMQFSLTNYFNKLT